MEEGQVGEEVSVSGEGEEEWPQNGDGGHDAPTEEGEAKPEEGPNGDGSADSPSEAQR